MAKGIPNPNVTPNGVDVVQTSDGLSFTVAWGRVKLIFLIPVTLFATLILLIILPFALHGRLIAGFVPIFLAFATLDLLLIYLSAAILLNSTRIVLTAQTISVSHAPIWFPGNTSIESKPVKALVCRYLFKMKPNNDFKTLDRVIIQNAVNSMIPDVIGYELTARDATGKKTVLVVHKNHDVVQWVQKGLLEKLKLKPVPDETRRPA